ncbi:hypothetical protein NL529_32040, partial [Klebsiella pneumoniae]|nr:hypothetical protein [Klebsiella pneumoniae]
EKDTMANVPAIKKIPPRYPNPDFESIELAKHDGSPISYKPKKERANKMNMEKKIRFSHTLVEMLLKISGLIALLAI